MPARSGDDLIRRHDAAIGQTVENHGDAVVMRRVRFEALDLGRFASREVAHHPVQIAVAAERQDEGDLVTNGWPAGGGNRKSASEADAHDPDPPVGREIGPRRHPDHGILDDVGRPWRDAIGLQIGQRHRHHFHAGAGQIVGEGGETRFIDAHRVNARHEQHRSPAVSLGHIHARRNVTVASRDLMARLSDDGAGLTIGELLCTASERGGAHDE